MTTGATIKWAVLLSTLVLLTLAGVAVYLASRAGDHAPATAPAAKTPRPQLSADIPRSGASANIPRSRPSAKIPRSQPAATNSAAADKAWSDLTNAWLKELDQVPFSATAFNYTQAMQNLADAADEVRRTSKLSKAELAALAMVAPHRVPPKPPEPSEPSDKMPDDLEFETLVGVMAAFPEKIKDWERRRASMASSTRPYRPAQDLMFAEPSYTSDLDRLTAWNSILKQLAESDSVDPHIRDLAVRAVTVVAGAVASAPDDGGPVDESCQSIIAVVDKAPVGDGPLAKTPQWRRIIMSLRVAGREFWGPAAETDAGRQWYTKGLQAGVERWGDRALEAVKDLGKHGKLATAEVILLRTEVKYRIKDFTSTLNASPPGRHRTQSDDPTEQSLRRLWWRIPAMKDLVRTGNIRPEVMAMILDSLKRDCKTLNDPKAVALLPAARQDEAEASAQEAGELLDKIETSLKESKPGPATQKAAGRDR